ncbi:LysR family transcriptional regulator [Dongia sp.]|uniref:LysR family transcriptional regulator n=1 Tax=Dongia sp. TaxID=1977262 RepID=UPI0035AEBD8B
MQTPDWNDLRHVLALGRAGSYSGAARLLQVNSTTVARRIKAIESLLAVSLFTRDANGALAPTAAGKITIARAEAIEAEIGSLTATVKGADQPATGNVRLTTVPIIANRLLIPALPALLDKHRGLPSNSSPMRAAMIWCGARRTSPCVSPARNRRWGQGCWHGELQRSIMPSMCLPQRVAGAPSCPG